MYRKYTVESDCWSFGVLLWEVLVFGKQPWFEYSNNEVIQNVTKGQVLEAPANCPEELYTIMCGCWKFDPAERIPIAKAHKDLAKLLAEHKRQSTNENYTTYSHGSKGKQYLMLSQKD